jgi:hypothetical protein
MNMDALRLEIDKCGGVDAFTASRFSSIYDWTPDLEAAFQELKRVAEAAFERRYGELTGRETTYSFYSHVTRRVAAVVIEGFDFNSADAPPVAMTCYAGPPVECREGDFVAPTE